MLIDSKKTQELDKKMSTEPINESKEEIKNELTKPIVKLEPNSEIEYEPKLKKKKTESETAEINGNEWKEKEKITRLKLELDTLRQSTSVDLYQLNVRIRGLENQVEKLEAIKLDKPKPKTKYPCVFFGCQGCVECDK